MSTYVGLSGAWGWGWWRWREGVECTGEYSQHDKALRQDELELGSPYTPHTPRSTPPRSVKPRSTTLTCSGDALRVNMSSLGSTPPPTPGCTHPSQTWSTTHPIQTPRSTSHLLG
jgi:hypothetical protein